MNSIATIDYTKSISETYIRIGVVQVITVDSNKVIMAIPKSDTATVDLIQQAIEAAYQVGQKGGQCVLLPDVRPLRDSVENSNQLLLYARPSTFLSVREFDGKLLNTHSQYLPVGTQAVVSLQMKKYTASRSAGVEAIIRNVCLFPDTENDVVALGGSEQYA